MRQVIAGLTAVQILTTRVFSLGILQEATGVHNKNETKKHHGKVNDLLKLY